VNVTAGTDIKMMSHPQIINENSLSYDQAPSVSDLKFPTQLLNVTIWLAQHCPMWQWL